MVQGVESVILNNSYKIYCLKCLWFWFWLIFVPYGTRAVFCSMDITSDIRLYHAGWLLAIVHWKATVWKNSNFYWNLIKFYSTQNGCGDVCVPYTNWLPISLWRRVLSRDSLPITTCIPLNWSIKWKIFGSRQKCSMSNY